MHQHLLPQFTCPCCSGSVKRLPRNHKGWDYAVMLLSDVPFWIVFGLCGAIGMWKWSAGVVAFAVACTLYYLWDRRRSSYLCTQCGTVSNYADIARAQASQSVRA
ncbi:MAG: hypothetical protein WCK83_02065 [Burkholderiales bacterium]